MLGHIQYVGTLKEILQLDYGPMASPIVLFHCNWVKNGTNNKGNPTYKRDDVRFLLANFHHMLHMSLMNLLFFLHKFSKHFFGMNQRHHGEKLWLGGNPKAIKLLWTLMMIALTHEVLCLGLKLY
jgi:hypothetical protein